MYKPKYFSVAEMIPEELEAFVNKKGVDWVWITLFDERLLRTMDMVREQFGRMTVNTWHSGGVFSYRGFRPAGCDIGARMSQHRFGRAVDMIPMDVTVDHVREVILDNPNSPRFHHIGGLELECPWLHIDVRGRRCSDKIMTFTP